MSEENRELVRRAFRELSSQDTLDLIEEFYAPDCVWHEPDRELRGYEQVREYLATNFEAFPDLNAEVEDVLAEGDRVVSRYTYRGTHQGQTEEYGPPTGKRVALEGITIHRIEDGKIVEEWEQYDNLGLLQQLGLAPEPGEDEPGAAPAAAQGEGEEEKGLLDKAREKLTGQ